MVASIALVASWRQPDRCHSDVWREGLSFMTAVRMIATLAVMSVPYSPFFPPAG